MTDEAKENPIAALAEEYRERFEANKRILTFDEYLDLVAAAPERHSRDAATYLRDTFDYYGSYPVDRPWGQETRFKLFDVPWEDGRDRLIGQERTQRLSLIHI